MKFIAALAAALPALSSAHTIAQRVRSVQQYRSYLYITSLTHPQSQRSGLRPLQWRPRRYVQQPKSVQSTWTPSPRPTLLTHPTVYSVSDSNIACKSGFQSPVSSQVIAVKAGDKVGMNWGHVIGGAQFANDADHPIAKSHKGPTIFYMYAGPFPNHPLFLSAFNMGQSVNV
jgi:cellulase